MKASFLAKIRPIRLIGSAALIAAVSIVPGVMPIAGASPGQSVTDLSSGSTAESLVSTLLGSGITTSNVTYTGDPLAAGTFSGLDAVGINSGVVMSSGKATEVVGPNSSSKIRTDFKLPGDADLTAIVGDDTFDASVLEFDFVPTASQITFKYVFGSEEYYQFVGEFNDAFAFWVNGANCATVPGTDPPQAVAINTINNGNPGSGFAAVNPNLFRVNTPGPDGPSAIDTSLDGLTHVLTCSATVKPNEKNHIKLAIADTGDGSLDSAVFLKAESFQSYVPPVCNATSVSTGQNKPVAAPFSVTDTNTDSVMTYATVTKPAHGTLSGTAPNLTYTPNVGYTGPDSIAWSADDSTSKCDATVTISVTPPPPPPAPAPKPAPKPAAPVQMQPNYTG